MPRSPDVTSTAKPPAATPPPGVIVPVRYPFVPKTFDPCVPSVTGVAETISAARTKAAVKARGRKIARIISETLIQRRCPILATMMDATK
jgi:hypothetical protein